MSDEVDDSLDEEPESGEPVAPMRDSQFGLASLFVLTAVCGVYFFIEKQHHGEFGIHALGAVALMFGVALPALLLVFWFLRMLLDGRGLLGTILFMATIAGAVAMALIRFWG